MRIKLSVLLAIVLSGITACSQSPDCFREDMFCVGLVTDTRGINDFGTNQETWAGLEQSQANGLVDHVAYIESVNAKDYEKNIAYFVEYGYDAIITSSIGLRDATLHSADLYPDSVFIGMNQTDNENRSNFIPVTFPEDQMGFLAGALAVQITQLGTVAAVCETSGIDAMWRYCEGFRAGANYMDDSIKVLVVYRDDGNSSDLFIDTEWGSETVQELVASGVDVIFAVGGETAVGALREANAAKIKSIGAERDQAAALGAEGSGVVTSVLGRTSFTVQELTRRLKGGNIEDVNVNPIGYIPMEQIVSRSVLEEMEAVLEGLENGEIMTDVAPEKP